ncbi:MAG: pentapeptide repeat-containing protein [Crocinitomicaceae bacterium]|nr:pentapeptide repeat-containing protein [Crocinitomicaceae bacterium]
MGFDGIVSWFKKDKGKKIDVKKKQKRVDELLSSTTSGIKFEEQNLNMINFSGKEVHDINFIASDMVQTNFSHSEVFDSYFRFCNLTNSVFSPVHLVKIKFYDSNLKKASFEKASLMQVDFEKSELIETNFRDTVLTETTFVQSDLTKADFSNANLRNAVFSKLNQMHQDMVNLFGVDEKKSEIPKYDTATISGTNFQNSDLTGADFSGTSCSSVDFSNATLIDVDFTNTGFKDCTVTGAKIGGDSWSLKNLKLWKESGAEVVENTLSDRIIQQLTGSYSTISDSGIFTLENYLEFVILADYMTKKAEEKVKEQASNFRKHLILKNIENRVGFKKEKQRFRIRVNFEDMEALGFIYEAYRMFLIDVLQSYSADSEHELKIEYVLVQTESEKKKIGGEVVHEKKHSDNVVQFINKNKYNIPEKEAQRILKSTGKKVILDYRNRGEQFITQSSPIVRLASTFSSTEEDENSQLLEILNSIDEE